MRLFRDNPEIIIESEKRRFKDPSKVNEVVEHDSKWRELLKKVESMRKQRNEMSIQISTMKKEGKNADELIKKMRELGELIEKTEKECEMHLAKRDEIRYTIGNILHKDVPTAEDENGNRVIRKWGKIENKQFKVKSHVDLLVERDLVDLGRAASVSGARFYYLKGDLVKLNFALINYAMDVLISKGFTPLHTPYLLRHKYMKRAAELGDFEETLYKINDEDLYLIATAEQPLAAYHADELINEDEFPKKYVGYSACFRREAGAHGKDTKGIFRVHQFDKIEQYVYCLPQQSWEWHEKLIKISEEIIQGLELPYRVVDIASGDMNDSAARKYDIEVWMPAQNTYRELVSCSNTTDYQARKMNVRVLRKDGKKEIAHTLNSTALATERTIVAIVENHEDENGNIKVPRALRAYLNGKEQI